VLAFTKAYPLDLRQQDTAVADLKTLRIAEAVFALPSFLEYREPFGVGLVECLIYSVG
jgi:hypothetical protein